MKRYRNRLVMVFISCMILCFWIQSKAQASVQEYQGFQYYYHTNYHFEEYKESEDPTNTVIDYGIVLTNYVGKEAEVVIPDEIDGIPVTAISTGCFMGNTYVQKVTIPDSVTELGRAIFYGCKNLQEVKLPVNDNIQAMPEATFAYCENLKSIVIPEGYGRIGIRAFYHCSSLHTVIAKPDPELSWCMEQIEDSAFEGCKKLRNIDLSHTTIVGYKAFKGCKSLKYINTMSVGKESFYGCTSLQEVYIFSEYTGERAFYGCKKLKRIEYQGRPFEIGKNAFKNIHKKAVFVVQKRYAKKWKQFLTKKTGFKQTMKIKTKKNED